VTAFDVAIAGLGYVGLPLALQFAEAGAKVLGLDIDPEKVGKLGKGESYLMHVEGARIRRLTQSGQLTVSTDFSLIAQAEAVVICVPTPLNKNREPDLSYILRTGEAVSSYLANHNFANSFVWLRDHSSAVQRIFGLVPHKSTSLKMAQKIYSAQRTIMFWLGNMLIGIIFLGRG
jgi:UDP-N-acetyl-D-mannosaminuronate dehydrogenase